MSDYYDKRMRVSHDLWAAKASARLTARGRLHRKLYELRRAGKIADDVMDEIYQTIADNANMENAEIADAEAAYDEVHDDEHV